MKRVPRIRRATLNDAKALSEAATSLFLQAYEGLIPAREMAAYVAANYNVVQQQSELSDPAVATLLVQYNSDIAGLAQVRLNPVPVKGWQAEVELQRIYIDQKWHGTGIAQILMKKVGDAARSFSARGIWLGVWEKNPRAISFYRKAGFEAIGFQEFRLHTLVQNDLVMRAKVEVL